MGQARSWESILELGLGEYVMSSMSNGIIIHGGIYTEDGPISCRQISGTASIFGFNPLNV